MPSLVRQQKTYFVDPAGKRVPKGTPGARKVKEKSRLWYGQGVPGQPPKKRVPLAADKTVARRMLDDLVRGAERGAAGMPDRDAGRVPLADLVGEFEADVALGLASRARRRKKPAPEIAALAALRVRACLDGCGFVTPADLGTGAAAKLAAYLDRRLNLPKAAGGISHQTAAFHLTAVKRFAWWMSAKRNLPVRPGVFDDVAGFDPKGNRVHARREIPPADLAKLLETARTSPRTVRGLDGPTRHALYLTAFGTGFRRSELARLTPANFRLDESPPVIVLAARDTKNGKPARQPIPPGVAAVLREYLKGRSASGPAFPGTWAKRAAALLQADLGAAGVPYSVPGPNGPEFADLHALRHTFLSSLAASGANPKELQELARHGDPKLTLSVYTHARPEGLAAAVARLPMPGGPVNPLAALTREELEGVTLGLLAVVGFVLAPRGSVDTPRDTPTSAAAGDDPRPTGTTSGRTAVA